MQSLLTGFRQSARRLLASAGKNFTAPLAVRCHRRPPAKPCDVTVHMLVSSRTWDAGMVAAASLEHQSARRWNFFFHDDGTLSAEIVARMQSLFADARIVRRAEGDAKAGDFLGSHAKCLAHRSRHNLFLKFFDFAAWAPGRRFIVLDSDVVFFRPPSEIMQWADSGSSEYRYNEDTNEKYCIPRGYLEPALGISLWPRVNSGLVLVPREAVSLDLAEELLSKFESTAHHPQFFEQTLYGLMGSAWGRGGALPRTYGINWGYLRGPQAVCRHYVGAFKHDLLFIEGATLFCASVLARRLVGR
jgi:hypothetical protein